MRILILSFVLFTLLNSCTAVNELVVYGIVPNTNPAKEYTTLGFSKGGFAYHHNSTIGQITNNSEVIKVSEPGCARSIFGLIAWGDASIETAKKSAGISKVASIEFRTRAVFAFLYHDQCIIIQGE